MWNVFVGVLIGDIVRPGTTDLVFVRCAFLVFFVAVSFDLCNDCGTQETRRTTWERTTKL